MDSKRILFLMRQPPYHTSHALEAIESILVAGAFDQQVSVLFRDDGVWQLLVDQDGEALGQRTIGKVLKALPQYDVSALYVCASSLAERGLAPADLTLPVEVLDAAAQQRLIAGQDAVVND